VKTSIRAGRIWEDHPANPLGGRCPIERPKIENIDVAVGEPNHIPQLHLQLQPLLNSKAEAYKATD